MILNFSKSLYFVVGFPKNNKFSSIILEMLKKKPNNSCKLLGFSFKFSGYSYLMLQHQLTNDRQSYQLVLIFTLKASTNTYFKEIEQLNKPLI